MTDETQTDFKFQRDAALANCDALTAERDAALDRVKELEAENERLREALTPSAATKAAYIGEVWWATEEIACVQVPWTATKETMKMILARATLKEASHDTEK